MNVEQIMEDDDLELLRKAALQSIQSKKSQNKEKVGNAIKVVESINSAPASTPPYFNTANSTAGSRIQTLVNPNDNSTINEPYLPQRRDAVAPWVETEYAGPYGVAAPPPSRPMIPNVQLSPRSAAFVSQNNDILNRRKVYAASPERNRSRSPITPPGRYNTPGRWSASPPPYKHVITRPHYGEHRSGSRSPIHRDKSPPQIYRRSPLPNSKSPPLALRKSRSPPPMKVRKSPLRKSLSGSPHRAGIDRHPASPYMRNDTRNRSPAGRYPHNQKNYRRYSPSSQNRSHNRKQLARRSLSPRNQSNNGHHPIKRSKSPVNSKRSRSRSPNRNVVNRSNRNERMNKRRSPLYNRKSNRNSNRSKRKLTPPVSPTNKKRAERAVNSVQQSTEDKKPSPTAERQKIEKSTDAAADKPEPTSEKSTENIGENEEGSVSSDDDKSSDENEDDGIDLFASEESESENEGRFKSNSSKNTRSNAVATVSFSKLGTSTTTTTMGDLNEMKSDKNATSSHREDRGYKRSSNYSSRRDDRSKKYGSSRNEDSRYGDSSRSSYKSRYVSSTASAAPKEDKKKDEKSMFKSTFQVLPNEMKSEAVKSTSKPTVSSRISPIKEKSGEKKLIVLKRPAESTVEDQIDEEADKIPSSTGDNAKKSVHARLGAPTKTWKNKKSWRTEKVSQTFYVNRFSLPSVG